MSHCGLVCRKEAEGCWRFFCFRAWARHVGRHTEALVWWRVANERRQATGEVTIGNWHGVVGNYKQTAATGILLLLNSFSWIKSKAEQRIGTWAARQAWIAGLGISRPAAFGLSLKFQKHSLLCNFLQVVLLKKHAFMQCVHSLFFFYWSGHFNQALLIKHSKKNVIFTHVAQIKFLRFQ